ncbi:MAG TPA: carbamoyltransferase HypF, partial [Elusimicrobia bacterium]|nr:carbamoyltransferase HypF [Elusimicrobiota bacterium]
MNRKYQRITVKGIVQGVGFRPFVYRIAKKNNLKGWVCNTSQGVIFEIVGEKKSLESFLKELKTSPPPAAKIDSIAVENIKPKNYINFVIKESIAIEKEFQPVSPDIATCNDCLKELFDPKDRRYRYPFINCTNCGPRFTIIEDIPYDRPKTTMRSFKMCPECQEEYDDPANRRFHAQPNACPQCGPEVELVQNLELRAKSLGKGEKNNVAAQFIEPIKGEKAIEKTIKLLKEGKIVALKGLGGFHLACDALNDRAVKELRKRKLRRDKPFALMMPDLETIKKYCFLSAEETKLLLSPQRPIVLLGEKAGSSISRFVAPYQKYQGVMLPYTPLHHLLFHPITNYQSPITNCLVMTSGNLSEEPIAMENEEALRRLKNIADYFLLHNRDIYSRYDDSVTRVFNHGAQILRRARSYAPYPIRLPFKVEEILATGPDLKNTFCLTKEKYAFISQHIGDMENLETLEHFENTLKLYKKLFRVNPKIIAYDLHPDYFSTKYALELSTLYSLLAT